MSALGIAALKAPEAFRTISEVAGELDVPQHVLRFWESRFAQVTDRSSAPAGAATIGRKMFDLLRGIQALLYVDGLTIRGVQKILKEQGLRRVLQIGRGKAPMRFTAPPVEKPAEKKTEAKKRVSHLRAVPPMSLPLFDTPEDEPILPPPRAAGLAAEERVKLTVLLVELMALKHRLRQARPAA